MNCWLKSSLLLLPAGTVFAFAYVIFLVFVFVKMKKSSLIIPATGKKVFVKLKKEQLVTAATGRVRICICICDNASICICKNEKEQLVTTATGRIVFVRPVVAGQWTVNQLVQSLFLIRQIVFPKPLHICSWSDNFFSIHLCIFVLDQSIFWRHLCILFLIWQILFSYCLITIFFRHFCTLISWPTLFFGWQFLFQANRHLCKTTWRCQIVFLLRGREKTWKISLCARWRTIMKFNSINLVILL